MYSYVYIYIYTSKNHFCVAVPIYETSKKKTILNFQ